MKKAIHHKGFTLIELIVYISIASIVLISAVGTGMNMIANQKTNEVKNEVYSNARFVMNQLQLQVRNAEDVIIANSSFDSNPGTLALDYPGADTDVVFDTYSKNVSIGGLETTITKLRMKDGSAEYVDLTSDQVNVTNFTLENLTRAGESKNINIQLTLEKANPGNDISYDASISLETALSIRS